MRGRSYVFASNHQSIYDIPIVFASLPLQLRIVAKASLGQFPVPRLAPAAHRASAGRPEESGRRHREEDGAAGRRSQSLIVFPEGTRSVDGTVGRFKGGIFLVAIDVGSAGRAGQHRRQPARDAQGPADDVPGRRHAHDSRADSDGGRRAARVRASWPSSVRTVVVRDVDLVAGPERPMGSRWSGAI